MYKKNIHSQALLLMLMIFFSLATANQVLAATFSDVPPTHFAYDAIEFLYAEKVIKGYNDGTFKPEKVVSKAEALKIVMEGSKLAVPDVPADTSSYFTDVAQSLWYARYIKKAKDIGIINGNPDGTFSPNTQVKKVELLKILLLTNQIDLSSYKQNKKFPYPDINYQEWYYPYLNYAIQYNLVYPDSVGKINPGGNLTRGEVAEIVYRFALNKKMGETQILLSQSESLLIQCLANIDIKDYALAKVNTEQAVNLTGQALSKNPDKTIVVAANKIALSMDSLIDAYLKSAQGQKNEALRQAENAKKIAADAKSIQPSVSLLTDKIEFNADKIISSAK